MKNGIFIKYVLFLLCLLPCVSFAQGITQAEYWFDTDYANKVVNKMNGNETYEIVSKVSTAQLDDGIHQFNFRVQQSDGKYSPILSRVFFKSAASKSSMLEYWFDDNYANKVSSELSSADEEGNVGMSLDLSDNTKFPIGNHQLHLRVTNSRGISAVYSASVLKLMSGKIELLEYWLDDDNSTVGYVYGKSAEGGKSFAEQVDLSKTSEGVHRLYYRGVSVSGGSSTAISSTPVMVKSRQNFDPAQQKVVSYSVAVDNEQPVALEMLIPDQEIELPYTLDARNLKEGNHTVTAKFWNTTGAGVSQKKTFKVGKAVTPSITLTAKEIDGEIALKFNSIPNDIKYRIWRMGSDGSQRKVFERQNPNYPYDMECYDKAPAGTYTYMVHGFYTDRDGTQKDIKSNEIKVEFTSTSTEAVKKTTIYGRITIDNEPVAILRTRMDVTFSDGMSVRAEQNGTFRRENVPIGTELTMTVKDCPGYTFDETKVVVSETTQNQLQIINATTRKDVAVQNDNAYYNLIINKEIEWRSNSFTLSVKNSSNGPWSGNIKMIAIKQSDDKAYLANNISYAYNNYENYFELASKHETFATWEIKSVDLKIEDENYPKIKENTKFNIYFLAEPDNSQGNAKLLETIVGTSENPKMLTLEPMKEHQHEELEDRWATIEECMDAIFDEMKTLKKYGIPLAEDIEKNSPVFQQFGKDLKEAIESVDKTLKPMQQAYESVENLKKKLEAIKDYNKSNDFEKWVTVCNTIIDMSGSPFADVYKLYIEATEKVVDLINRVLDLWEDHDYTRMFANCSTDKPTQGYQFHIKVAKPKTWYDDYVPDLFGDGNSYFSGQEILSRLSDKEPIKIYMIVDEWNIKETYTGVFNVHSTKGNEIRLNGNVSYDNSGQTIGKKPKQFWMELKWANGRKSIVPLLNKDVVEYDSGRTNITVRFRSGVNSAWNMDDILHILPYNSDYE